MIWGIIEHEDATQAYKKFIDCGKYGVNSKKHLTWDSEMSKHIPLDEDPSPQTAWNNNKGINYFVSGVVAVSIFIWDGNLNGCWLDHPKQTLDSWELWIEFVY